MGCQDTSMDRVAAVVVTYNRKALLVECLRALSAQTRRLDRIHVVDNASTDGTRDTLADEGLLDHPGVVYHRLEHNGGSSGGFAHGVEVARADGCDWIWIMDDDAEPRPDCLERLLASPLAGDPATAVLAPTVAWPDGAPQLGHRGQFDGRPRGLLAPDYDPAGPPVRIGYVTFVGPLVRTRAARAIDPPFAPFFIYSDDFEYSLRLREQGAMWLLPAAVILHKEARNPPVTRRGAFFNRVLGWQLSATTYEAAWRNLFAIRNYVWLRTRHEHMGRAGFALVVAQFVLKAFMYDERPVRRVPWLIRYALHGRRGTFRNFAPEEWARKAAAGRV
jgi:rhamnopyranosyl-N-acetylglucosaminyl-diphospho-decaprenol beta-1,3/1,4-galactofuranosyltransferase